MSVAPTAQIHPSSVIKTGALIGAHVQIGPFCHIGADVVLGDNVELKSHIAVAGHTQIGEGTQIFPHASVGLEPQDLKFEGEKTFLEIGKYNRIREFVTLSPGTKGGGGLTKVGDHNLLMIGTHVGHDCMIGNRNVFANYVNLGGHVVIHDNVVMGTLSAVHQFCRIGRGAMIGAFAAVVADIIPYGVAMGERSHLAGLNLVGMKRANMDRDDINALRAAFKLMFESGAVLKDTLADVSQRYPNNAFVAEVVDFIQSDSSRSFHTPKS